MQRADITTVRHNYRKIQYHPRMAGTLRKFGLYQLASMHDMYCDGGLCAGLIERWRPETHTFHMPFGEMTVTLQDVSCLWGLSITGEPVTGVEYGDFRGLCMELLGIPADSVEKTKRRKRSDTDITTISQQVISLPKLRSWFPPLSDDSDELTVARHTRAFILELFSLMMFPDSSGDVVRLCFLPFLRDLDNPRQMNWGAAVLAYLYRGLCMACQRQNKTFIGPAILLQHWSYARFPIARPSPKDPTWPVWGAPDPEICQAYGAQYCQRHTFIGTPHGAQVGISYFRGQFEQLRDDMVRWTPYHECVPYGEEGREISLIHLLPDRCREHRRFWLAEVPLIFFQVVEHHYPSRVMRQFDYRQVCPPPPPITESLWRRLHVSRNAGFGKNWADIHRDYVELASAQEPPLAQVPDFQFEDNIRYEINHYQ